MDSFNFRTDFESETTNHFYADMTRVYTVDEQSDIRHLQAACLHKHSTGQWMIVCRADFQGESEGEDAPTYRYAFGEKLRRSAEGDSSNVQVMFFSLDEGKNWTMANDGLPILTLDHGTSFDEPSGIPHAMIVEDTEDNTWLYYTINQPFTCGPDAPWRATGGGEIRKIRIKFYNDTWITDGNSEVVWGCMRPLPDGRGGAWDNVRTASLNPILQMSNGVWLMPIMGRSTIENPQGAYWKFNRCWVLESQDNGKTWANAYFIGGSNTLSLCEPTLVETAVSGEVVAYMRVQYSTGNQLYRAWSSDYGRTWSAPEPTGLPNTNTSGTKPLLMKLESGDYVLIQTNEHFSDDRTNMTIFKTDEEGLHKDNWKLTKVLLSECESGWRGSCYAWGIEDEDSSLHISFVSFYGGKHFINYTRVEPEWLEGTVLEPVAPKDDLGDDLPYLSHQYSKSGKQSLKFPNVRSRAQATKFSRLIDQPSYLSMSFFARSFPETETFHLMHVSSFNGRELAFTVSLRPKLNQSIWIMTNGSWIDTGVSVGQDWVSLVAWIDVDFTFRIQVNGEMVCETLPLRILSDQWPDTWQIGGSSIKQTCEIYVDDIAYGIACSELKKQEAGVNESI